MAKATCSDCGGSREPDSPTYSYCKACSRKRARERYAATREAQGYTVNSRGSNGEHLSAEEVRRRRIIANQGKPGICDCCHEYESASLEVMCVGDRNNEEHLFGGGEMRALWCQKCLALVKLLTDEVAHRIVTMVVYLKKQNLLIAHVLPDPQDAIMGTVPTPITLTPHTANAQKAPNSHSDSPLFSPPGAAV